MVVGDDSVHRAIAELRRAIARAGVALSVETIPRVGYRLAGLTPSSSTTRQPSRRAAVAGGLVALGAVGAGWEWLSRRSRTGRVEELLERARQALRQELPYRDAQGLAELEQAVRLAPDDPAAWGLVALAWRNIAEAGPPAGTSAAAAASERAARHALALDPREGNALAALATLKPMFGDWVGAERRLLDVVRRAGLVPAAVNHLVLLYQSSGLASLSLVWNRRAAALDPLSPVWQ